MLFSFLPVHITIGTQSASIALAGDYLATFAFRQYFPPRPFLSLGFSSGGCLAIDL